MSDQSLALSLPLGMDTGKIILHSSRIYDTDVEAVAQVIENQRDACARHTFIELYPNHVVFTDDGCGLIKSMVPVDSQRVREWIGGKRDVSWETLMQEIRFSSKQSLEVMVCSIGRSSKKQDGTQYGEKHIGCLAFYTYGDQAVFFTRPSEELQQDAGIRLGPDEVFQLRTPTAEQLEKGTDDGQPLQFGLLGPITRVIKTPWGERLIHGTQIIVTGLHSGANHSLAPALLADYLGTRFGEDIRSGMEITVIDRMTEEAKKQVGGRVIKVSPPVFKGVGLVDRTIQTTHGKHTFRVQLFYAAGGRNVSPMLRRKGSDIRPLRDLAEEFLGQPPWNRVVGFVEAPEDLHWSSNKKMPNQDRTYYHWIQRLKSLSPEIDDLITEADRRSRERTAGHYQGMAAAAVLSAMAETPLFRDQPVGILPPARKQGAKRRKKIERVISKQVRAAAMDENGEPVAGATIELYCGSQLIETKVTGATGHASFGRQKVLNRQYHLRLTNLPKGYLIETDKSDHGFPLSDEQPGHSWVFHVLSGRQPKEDERPRRLDRKLQVWMHDIPDVDPLAVLYVERLPTLIEINTANPFIGGAMDDREALDPLVALCCSAAVSAYTLRKQGVDKVLQAQGPLFAAILENLEESRKKERRKRKK